MTAGMAATAAERAGTLRTALLLALALAACGAEPRGAAGPDQEADLQAALAQYEAAVAWLLGTDQADLQACWTEDRAAFARRLATCAGTACRVALLRERLAELQGWQSDSQRIAGLALPPPRRELLAILAPEGGAAPARQDEPPPQAREGVLVHAATRPEHMGLAVATAEGEHVIVFDDELGNHDAHHMLLDMPGVPVRVLGHLRVAADGIADFDTARCRRVYRLHAPPAPPEPAGDAS